MPETDAFDPTHALDGWRPPAPAPVQELDLDALLHPRPQEAKPLLVHAGSSAFDPTHLLDGWRPPAPAPLDLELKSMLRAGSVPDEAKLARLKARGYEMLDVEDIELVEAPPAQVVVEARVQEIPPAPPAEAELAPPVEAAVDLPLSDEEVWPLFMEEAQVLDAGTAAPEPEFQAESPPSVEPELETPVAAAAELRAAELETEEAPVEPAPLADTVAASEAPVLDFHAFPPPPPAGLEAPVLDFRAAPPPPEPDPEAVIAGIELPRVAAPPVAVEMPQLNIAALTPQPPEPDPRLLAQWQAGAWTALARRVAGASEELLQTSAGLRVQSHASQWLCAIWPPQAQDAPLGRWPELAALVAAETTADAMQQLLPELPDEAGLWPADLETDWGLLAELVLHQDTGLRSSQARALREFATAERHARLAHFGEAYALQGRVARRRA